MKTVDDFFNKTAKEIDVKYFPEVKYYRDDKNNVKVHHALELFSNGCLTYDKLTKHLSINCNDIEDNIKNIVDKYIIFD